VKKGVLAVIPARFASSRFRGKVLAILAGKPVVQHVYERASRCGAVDKVVVATDDRRVEEAVRGFGGEAIMTSGSHRCGTERAAEVASRFDWPVILNVQGDEPLIAPESLGSCVEKLVGDDALDACTLATPLRDGGGAESPHVVKVVMDTRGRALYFSRSAIPFAHGGGRAAMYKHIGVYCYRRDYLLRLVTLEPGPLEIAEGLEQLRVLEHGGIMGVAVTPRDTVGVDLPEDLAKAERALASAGSSHG
jgi:3-deoxy-manno-octulosonate cytidylyltransferase (CMP-KDO synthetase)